MRSAPLNFEWHGDILFEISKRKLSLRVFQNRVAIWNKVYTVLYSAFRRQRCWEANEAEQETSNFKGGFFENNIVI